jgi:K+-transporting ATPase ATPase A chain
MSSSIQGWSQLALYLAALLLITKPLGIHLVHVLDANGRTFLDPLIKPLEKLSCRLLGLDPRREQNWKQYAVSMLIFSMGTMAFTYGILRLQDKLPVNPQKFGAISPGLVFNTAASFTTNTN